MRIKFNIHQGFPFIGHLFYATWGKMDPKLVAYLDKALSEIYAGGNIQKAQKKAFFIPDFLPSK